MAGALQRNIAIAIQLINRDVNRGVDEVRARLAALRAEVDENDKSFARVGKGLAIFGKGAVVLSALSGVITVVGATTAALQSLLPIVLLAPAGILALGAAFATFKIATAGFGDALKSGDLSKLSPQAAAAASAIRSLGPAFDVVKRATQDAFFKNFAADVKTLGATYLPILGKRLPEIAAGFNAMGRSVAFALTRPATSSGIDKVLTNTAKLLANARNALGAFASGFVLLGAAGSTYLPRIGIALDGVAQRFERFAKRITTDGSFQQFVDGAVKGFRDLFNIIGDVSAIVGSIFTGLAGPQGDVLGNLRQTTEALRAFFEAASTQSALGALGEALRVVGAAVREVLLAALQQLAPIISQLAPVVAEIAALFGAQLANAIGIVGPLLVGLSGFLNEHKEIVALVGDALLILYTRFLVMKGITAVSAAIAALTRGFSAMAAAMRLIPIVALGAIAVELDKINVAAAKADNRPLTELEDTLHDLVDAGKQLLTLDFGGIIAEIQSELAGTDGSPGIANSPIVQFFDTIGERAAEFGRTTKASIDEIVGFFRDLPGKVGTALSEFGTTVKGKLDEAGRFLDEKVTEFQEFPGKVGKAIGDKASEIWDTFLTGVREKFQPVKDFFSQTPYEIGFAIGTKIGDLINKGRDLVEQIRLGAVEKFEEVRTFFAEAPGKLAEAVGTLAEMLRTKASEAWEAFKAEAGVKIEEARVAAAELPGKVRDALAELGPFLVAKAIEAWESFKTEAGKKIDEAVAFVKDIPRRVGEALNPLPPQTKTKGTETGQGFLDGITQKFTEVVTFVQGIPRRVLDALGNVGSLLRVAGESLMNGLLDGIKAGYQAALDFARGIAAGIAAVKGPLSFDKRVLTPNGLALMSGLLAGVQTGYAEVKAFASGIAGDLATTIDTGSIISSASRAATAATAPSTATPTQDLLRQLIAATSAGQNVQVFIGETELTQLVDAQVSTANRSTARTVRQGAGLTY